MTHSPLAHLWSILQTATRIFPNWLHHSSDQNSSVAPQWPNRTKLKFPSCHIRLFFSWLSPPSTASPPLASLSKQKMLLPALPQAAHSSPMTQFLTHFIPSAWIWFYVCFFLCLEFFLFCFVLQMVSSLSHPLTACQNAALFQVASRNTSWTTLRQTYCRPFNVLIHCLYLSA